MPSATNGPAAKSGAGDKPGNAKDGFIAKAAGAVIAAGIAWSVFKSVVGSKAAEEYVEESLGFRPSSGGNRSTVDDLGSDAKEQTDEVTSSLTNRETEFHREAEEPGSTVGRKSNPLPKESRGRANKATGKFRGVKNHEIVGGDTLYTISQKYEVSVEALKDVNGLFGDHIVAGDKLIIPNK